MTALLKPFFFIYRNRTARFSVHDAFCNRPKQFCNFNIRFFRYRFFATAFYYNPFVDVLIYIDCSYIF